MRNWTAPITLLLCFTALIVGEEDIKLRRHLKDHKYASAWIYEDIDAGFAEAKRTGKPLLVSLCCVP